MSKSINQGENNGSAKLNVQAVKIIRHLLACGHTGQEIALVYGISKATVSMIKIQKLWNSDESKLLDKWRD
jgi:DNA-binding NarL/FixJ family response regulator